MRERGERKQDERGRKEGSEGNLRWLWEKDEQLQIVMLRKVVEEWAFIGYYHTDLLPGSLLTFHEYVYSLASSGTQT